ncbi:hypothetical protein KDA_18660 [Dictyobacter alpinus]|uniref:Uncharacterized protein n=1 Tax=Dictyobacter alpinus TaxID=2014873 RepID=A0A402B4X5_9CHLR|nr:hypothetical protein KDA_18660 [Dictyobacter alpinus]
MTVVIGKTKFVAAYKSMVMSIITAISEFVASSKLMAMAFELITITVKVHKPRPILVTIDVLSQVLI